MILGVIFFPFPKKIHPPQKKKTPFRNAFRTSLPGGNGEKRHREEVAPTVSQSRRANEDGSPKDVGGGGHETFVMCFFFVCGVCYQKNMRKINVNDLK